MDEPFGALDAQTRTQLQTELLETWEKDRKTCFFITHDVEEAIILAQKVIIMSARPGPVSYTHLAAQPRLTTVLSPSARFCGRSFHVRPLPPSPLHPPARKKV